MCSGTFRVPERLRVGSLRATNEPPLELMGTGNQIMAVMPKPEKRSAKLKDVAL
jgi:hypothetical protein